MPTRTTGVSRYLQPPPIPRELEQEHHAHEEERDADLVHPPLPPPQVRQLERQLQTPPPSPRGRIRPCLPRSPFRLIRPQYGRNLLRGDDGVRDDGVRDPEIPHDPVHNLPLRGHPQAQPETLQLPSVTPRRRPPGAAPAPPGSAYPRASSSVLPSGCIFRRDGAPLRAAERLLQQTGKHPQLVQGRGRVPLRRRRSGGEPAPKFRGRHPRGPSHRSCAPSRRAASRRAPKTICRPPPSAANARAPRNPMTPPRQRARHAPQRPRARRPRPRSPPPTRPPPRNPPTPTPFVYTVYLRRKLTERGEVRQGRGAVLNKA